MNTQEPISDDSKSNNSGCARVLFGLFGLVFLSVGLSVFYFNGLKPYLQKRQSTNWPTTKCEITQAKLEEHRGDDSTSYTADFRYRFNVNGRPYSGQRYSFADEPGSRTEAKRQLKAFPRGSTQECFYNPEDPADCVLDRTNQDQGWESFIFPFIFVGFGAVAFGGALFGPWGREKSISGSIASKRAKVAHSGADAFTSDGTQAIQLGGSKVAFDTPADQLDAQWSKPMKLKPASTRTGTAIGVAFFALFWNGIISVLFFPGQFGNFGWGQIGIGLFSIPFVLIGLLLIFGTTYSIVAIFNPTVEIAFSSGAVPLGGQVDIAWQIEGRFERIKKLTIEVLASQHATYQRGTDTITDEEVFEKLPIIETTEIADIAFGSTTVTIPVDSMHTFDAKRNKIKWQVMVRGEIPWAPDISEEFEFRVTPVQAPSRS